MINIIFYATFYSLLILDIMILITISSKIKFWPPLKSKTKLILNWIPTYIFMGGIILIGYFDFNTFIFKSITFKIISLPLILIGLYIAIAGFISFKTKETLGIDIIKLKTTGIYAISRNPQYTGDILWIFGYMIFCNSLHLYIVGPMAILWFLLAPIAEEPILFNIFGEDFNSYKNTTPKFINYQSIKKLFRRKLK